MVKIFAFHFRGFDRTTPRSAPGLADIHTCTNLDLTSSWKLGVCVMLVFLEWGGGGGYLGVGFSQHLLKNIFWEKCPK